MRRSPLLPIFLIVLVDVLAMTILIPLLPFYAQRYGASPFVVGLLASAFSLCQLLSGPLLGGLSDRHGRRPLLLISQVGTFAGLLLLAWADQLWLIFVARLLDGATAGNLSIAQAYVSDVTTREDRAKGFGLIGVAFGIGFVVGPGVSALLQPFGYGAPILGAAGMSLLSIVATYFLLPADPPRPAEATGAASGRRLGVLAWGQYRAFVRRPVLGGLLLQFFLFCLAFSMFTSGFALFAERRFTWDGRPFGPREVGLVFVYVGVLGIILQGGLLGRLVKRFGERRLAIAGFAFTALGYLGLAAATTIGLLLLVGTIASIGNGSLRPSLTSEVTHVTGRSEQGVVLGLTQSLFSIAAIVAPPIGTALIEHGELAAWALVAAGISALGFLLAIRRRAPVAVEA